MIKLKNSEISAFSNPIISKLFDDPERKFPISDVFVFVDLLDQIQRKIKLYQEQVKIIIEVRNKGKINGDGSVGYETKEDQANITKELEELNNLEVEISGDKLIWKDSWPELSIREAYILRPLIQGE